MKIVKLLPKGITNIFLHASWLITCVVVSSPALHAAFTYPEKPAGRVADLAKTLSLAQIERLEIRLESLSRKTDVQAVVVTLPSLQGEVIEDVAVNIFQKWGIGDKEKNKGILLLVSQQERSVRIEVGYGLEAAITDAISSRIIREELIPLFKSGQYYTAYISFVLRLEGILSGEVAPNAQRHRPQLSLVGMAIAIILLLGLITILQPSAAGRIISSRGTLRNSPRGGLGGFGGGGFGGGGGSFGGGFGGGMSGGGGASGSW